jgi:hypothetical protein
LEENNLFQDMRFYNYLYAGYAYLFKLNSDSDYLDPRPMLFVIISMYLHLVMIILVIQKSSGIILFPKFENKYWYGILMVPWMIFGHLYYSKGRVKKILAKLDERPQGVRFLATIAGVCSFVLPLITIILLTKK